MANKNIVNLTESKLREIITSAVKETLREGFLSKVSDKVKGGLKTAQDKFYDFHQGFDTKEGNPQSIEDVFEGDGWKVVKTFNKNGSTYYAVKPVTGAFAEHFGPQEDDMAEELNIFLDGHGTASYEGEHPKYSYIHMFKIDF